MRLAADSTPSRGDQMPTRVIPTIRAMRGEEMEALLKRNEV